MSTSLITLIPLYFGFLWPTIKIEQRIEVVPIQKIAPVIHHDQATGKMSKKELEDAFNKLVKEIEAKKKINNPDNWKQKK